MIELVERMPAPLRRADAGPGAVRLRAQPGRRAGNAPSRSCSADRRARARAARRYGILGRVYKDRWEAAAAGTGPLAEGSARQGDRRLPEGLRGRLARRLPRRQRRELMELRNPPDRGARRSCPWSRYAVERGRGGEARLLGPRDAPRAGRPRKDEARAPGALGDALAAIREAWEPKSTLSNLRFIGEERAKRGESVSWAGAVEEALAERGRELEARQGAAT